MANFTGLCRSNYFRVKNRADFAAFCQRFDLTLIEEGDAEVAAVRPTSAPAETSRVGFVSDAEEGLPSTVWNAETDETEDADPLADLAPLLADGEVAVCLEIGWEKTRYLIGAAYAVHSSGALESLSLNAIYALAEARWQMTPGALSRAEY